MIFAIKAELSNPRAKTFAFSAQKTMYAGISNEAAAFLCGFF
jgi:hypothetical protein